MANNPAQLVCPDCESPMFYVMAYTSNTRNKFRNKVYKCQNQVCGSEWIRRTKIPKRIASITDMDSRPLSEINEEIKNGN